jgi:hypothetical protein
MTSAQILGLLLAIAVALNVAFVTAWLTHRMGLSFPAAVLAGGSAAAGSMILYFTGLSAYGGPR